MRHPSIVIIHPWNETEGEELDTAFAALTEIVSDYPPLVIAHRDTLHIHKYWWGLFENIGLYYDSAEQFPQPIVVDEFGGNYLDGEGMLGGYPSLKESFLRFLGRGHTPELRLQLQTESNTQIAEYWRRLGAAGFSPFCMAGSWEDGNHHFLGPLCEGRPKPVWDGLTAAYSPVSCSLEVWDRNFIPGQAVTLPLYLFNETAVPRHMTVEVRLVASDGTVQTTHTVHQTIDASTTEHLTVDVTMPAVEGDWRLEAEVLDRPQGVLHPIISQWHVRTIVPTVPKVLCGATVAVPEEETELRALLAAHGLTMCALGDPAASVAIISRKTWELLQTDRILLGLLEATVMGGCGLVMLDIGPRELGQGYLEGGDLGPLQAVMTIANPGTVTVDLLGGMMLEFTETPEPESCVHPSEADNSLWAGLDQQATWLWNGLRGGLMVPARDMTPLGMNAEAFLTLWGNRGADVTSITGTEDYMAYELCGFYAFSLGESDQVQHDLRARVRFLYDDAP
ncbi:MAG TPA: glycoside hydrolase, partial [Armatimonadota bacterium]|nr:glycoside hydrolase [Armatimonadota bacterium]